MTPSRDLSRPVLGAAFARDIAEQPDALARVLDCNDGALDQARELVDTARSVRLLGIGSSRHAAGVGAAALEMSGTRADVPPAPGAAVPPPVLHHGDLVVAISQSGTTPALIAAARRAVDAGCRLVTVTNASGPLVDIAHVSLDCAAGPEHVVAATKSVTTSIALLRALAGPVDLAPLVTAIDALLVRDMSRVTAGALPAHVVAGGLGAEWVAAEIALKIAETAGRLVTSEPLVEHLHGPVAVPATTLAFVHADDPNVDELVGDVVRVGPDPAYELTVPALADPASGAILTLVAGQLIALAWARRTGVDADAPRGLSKVTRTA